MARQRPATPRQLPAHQPGTPDWEAQRARRLGASEIAAVLGLSKWTSAFALWHTKTGTLPPDYDDNPSAEWGRRLEPVIAAKWAEGHPTVKVTPSRTFVRDDRPYQLATPDKVLREAGQPRRPLECKTARYGDVWEWGQPGTDQIPPYYRCQVVWQCDTMGADYGHVAVLIGASDYREYVVPWTPQEAEALRAEAAAFIASLDGEPPPLDGADATYWAVRELHPDIDDVVVDIDPALARAYAAAHSWAESAKTDLRALTARVAECMGSARQARCGGVVVANRQAKGQSPPYVVAGRSLTQLLTNPPPPKGPAA